MPVAYKKCSHRAAACVCCLHNAVCCCVCCLHNGRVQTSAQPGSVWPIIAPDPGGSRPRVQRLNPHQGSTTANVLRPASCLFLLLCHRTEQSSPISRKSFLLFLRFLSLCLASIPILSDRLFYAASASRSERGGGSKIHTAWGAGCLKKTSPQAKRHKSSLHVTSLHFFSLLCLFLLLWFIN